ncbi:MAG: GNAT family N-acetyltransferase, partial [Bacteroidota bacterium]
LIGEISLHIEEPHEKAHLGYWLGEPFWNQGIATEAARVVLQFGFEKLELEKVIASHYRGNESSGKVMTKNGFQQGKPTGNLVQYAIDKQAFTDFWLETSK